MGARREEGGLLFFGGLIWQVRAKLGGGAVPTGLDPRSLANPALKGGANHHCASGAMMVHSAGNLIEAERTVCERAYFDHATVLRQLGAGA
jgi:hypothetical protein